MSFKGHERSPSRLQCPCGVCRQLDAHVAAGRLVARWIEAEQVYEYELAPAVAVRLPASELQEQRT